jgi:hypothetical protein
MKTGKQVQKRKPVSALGGLKKHGNFNSGIEIYLVVNKVNYRDQNFFSRLMMYLFYLQKLNTL